MLPNPYDDEIFYSVLARHADHVGLHEPAAFNQLVFGTARLRPIIEFPSRLDLLLPRLLPGSRISGTSLIADNSLVPYFTTFMSDAAVAEAKESVIRADAVFAFSKLGTGTIVNSLRLRLCDACVAADLTARREPYWRRAHQLPGCLVCAMHGSPLRDGPSPRGAEGAGFVSVSRALATGAASAEPHAPSDMELAKAVATISALLLHRPNEPGGDDRLARLYDLLWEAGWKDGSRLAARNLMDDARKKYGSDILAAIGVHHNTYRPVTTGAEPATSTDWLAVCLRVRSRQRHPLPYVLLMIVAGVAVASLLSPPPTANNDAAAALAGPCGNVVCPDYDPPVPRPLPATGAVDVACPTCGFAYRQRADATARKDRRSTTYGHLLDEAIREECRKGDKSRPRLEQELGLSTETIKARAQELGVWSPRWGEQTRVFIEKKRQRQWTARRDRSAEQYRRKWLRLAKRHPGLGRLALGRRDMTTYSFLRTHDREWLDETTPMAERTAPTSTRPASEADERLATMIDAAADELLAADPPERVTRVAMARRLGKALFRVDATRMPRTAATLAARAEGLGDFHARRADREASTGQADSGGSDEG